MVSQNFTAYENNFIYTSKHYIVFVDCKETQGTIT